MSAVINPDNLPIDAHGVPREPSFVVQVDLDGDVVQGASSKSPVAGTFTALAASPYATGKVAGIGISASFSPGVGRGVRVKLRGNNPATPGSVPGAFGATVLIMKSTNEGVSWDPVTIGGGAWGQYTAPCYEAIDSEDDVGAIYRLVCTAYTSGTVYYSIGHS